MAICPGCAFPVVIAIVFLLNDAFIKSLNQCAQGSRFIESMAFTVSCRNCEKHFKTGYSTKKHHEKSHPELQFDGGLFKNCQGHPLVDQPIPKQLEGEELESYKTWLAILAEQMSGSLNPNAKAGWQQYHENHMKKDHFQHLLLRLGSPPLHQVRDVKHYKQPIFHTSTRRFSYRIHDLDTLRNVLDEQDVAQLQTSAAFRHGAEVNFQRYSSTSEAVEAAKQMAFLRFTSSSAAHQTPTSRSEMVVSVREGRATRELELIWWPNMFRRCAEYGKLTVPFFCLKDNLQTLNAISPMSELDSYCAAVRDMIYRQFIWDRL